MTKSRFLYFNWYASGTDHRVYINGITLSDWDGRGSNCFAISKGDSVYINSTSGISAGAKVRYYKD